MNKKLSKKNRKILPPPPVKKKGNGSMAMLIPGQIKTIIAYYDSPLGCQAGPVSDRKLLEANQEVLGLDKKQVHNFAQIMSYHRKRGDFPGFTIRRGAKGGTIKLSPEVQQQLFAEEEQRTSFLKEAESLALQAPSDQQALAGYAASHTSIATLQVPPQSMPGEDVRTALHDLYTDQASLMVDLAGIMAKVNTNQMTILRLLSGAQK